MAVDKNLPNDPDHDRVKLDIEPNEREVELKEEETTKGPIEINPTEDGGVEVDFDPNAIIGEGGQNHEANLAEYIDDNILGEFCDLSPLTHAFKTLCGFAEPSDLATTS